MNNSLNPALEKYAEMMIQKIGEVEASNWQKPWFTPNFVGLPQNLTGRKYNNYNKALLYLLCDIQKYQVPVFITFNQAQQENVLILKGSKSFPVIYYDLNIKNITSGERISKEQYDTLSIIEKKDYKVLRIQKFYNVFNLEQTNFAEKYPERWENLKNFFKSEITIKTDGYRNNLIDSTIENQKWICPIYLKQQNRAFYNLETNSITLPTMEQFPNGIDFYDTALHEMAHSTGHSNKLDRPFGYRGTPQYAKEELIAELSSAVSGRDLGLSLLPRKENAEYLKGWLAVLNENPKYITEILHDVNKAVTMIEEGIGFNKVHENELDINKRIPIMTENEFLASKRLSSPFCDYMVDKLRIPHGETARAKKHREKEALNARNEYELKRQEARKEFREKINNGEFREPTKEEIRQQTINSWIEKANGEESSEVTQRSRRLLKKRGIDWHSQKSTLLSSGSKTQKIETNIPTALENIIETQNTMNTMKTAYGLEFNVVSGINQEWSIYDKTIAECHLSQWGVIAVDKAGFPIDNEYDYEGINNAIKSSKSSIQSNKKAQEIYSSGNKTLMGDTSFPTSKNPEIVNLRIQDKFTGKTEPLDTGNIDLSKQSPEAIKSLLSGGKVEMTDRSGINNLVGLSKTPLGWGISSAKQIFNTADSSAGI